MKKKKTQEKSEIKFNQEQPFTFVLQISWKFIIH